MKKIISIVLLLCCSYSLKAQNGPSGFHIGLGLEGALPSTGFDATYNIGTGATLRLSKGVSEHIYVTLTGGAIAFFPKTRFNSALGNKASVFIPVKAGARLMLSDKIYLLGELGLTLIRSYRVTSINASTATYGYVNNQYFTYAPSFGTLFGPLDISLRYENLQRSGFIGLRVGYNF